MVEPLEIGRGFQDRGRGRDIEIEETRLADDRLVPATDQEPRNGDPLREMLVLEPLLELDLASRRDVVEDREDAGEWRGGVG